MNAIEEQLLADVGSMRDRQLALTQDLIRIRTVNPYSGDESAHIETEGQQWIAQRFGAMGAKVRNVPVPEDVYVRGGMIGPKGRSWKNRENVIAEWTFGSPQVGPTILVNNHMDTVGTAGMEIDPFDPVVRDGKLFGRGASDTKGNTVVGLIAIEALLRHAKNLRGRLIYEMVVDEECNGAGAGTLACCLAGVKGDFVLVLDGIRGEMYNGCNGVATARVIVKGQAGHSSHGVSVSAIDKGILVKAAIDRFAAAYKTQHPNCAHNVGIFRAGTLPAIVPGECELQINFNYHQEDALAAEKAGLPFGGALYRQRFELAMAALGAEDEWFARKPAEVSWIKDMYPFACTGDDRFTHTALQATSEVQGRSVGTCHLSAWGDAAHLSRHLKVPVLGASAGTPGQAHAAAEHVKIDDLYASAQELALSLYRLLS